jgi:small-conductance mechanosensitive channel
VPTPHAASHVVIAATLAALSAVAIVIVRNRVIRRRLLFSAIAAVVAVAVHAAAGMRPDSWLPGAHGARLEQLIIVLAVANAVVSLLFNPWYRDGESDRAPAIVQDSLVILACIGAGVLLFRVSSFSFLTGSAIVAAVVGFALQDTLGNAFAGIAIQIERPFRVGHWIAVGEWVGLVTEVTWRATKIRTKAGNLVTVPNSVMSSQAITNYSEPTAPTRLSVDVGAARCAAERGARGPVVRGAGGRPRVVVAGSRCAAGGLRRFRRHLSGALLGG